MKGTSLRIKVLDEREEGVVRRQNFEIPTKIFFGYPYVSVEISHQDNDFNKHNFVLRCILEEMQGLEEAKPYEH